MAPPAPPIPAPPAPPGPTPVLPAGVCKVTLNVCQNRLEQLNLEKGERIMASPCNPNKRGSDFPVMTNLFGLELLKDTTIYAYTVDMSAEMRSGKKVVFTLKARQDYPALSRHEKCFDILHQTVKENEDFFKVHDGNNIIYDGQSLFFTTVDLFPEIELREKKKKIFQINGINMENSELQNLEVIQFEIYACEREKILLTRERLLEYTADANLDVNDRSLHQFMELVINQKCASETKRFSCFKNGRIYCVNPLDEGYKPADVTKKNGKVLKPGFKKSVVFIEGPNGRGNNNPALLFDSMKSEFHISETLSEKIISANRSATGPMSKIEIQRMSQSLKGVTVTSTYTGKLRCLKFEAIHVDNALNSKFKLEDGTVTTVQQYFLKKYNVQLKHSQLNLVICKDRDRKNYYPAELLTVAPNQRVTIQQNVSNQQKDIKECAVLPQTRQRLILTGMDAAGLLEENKLLKSFGIHLFTNPLVVGGKQLENISVNYKNLSPPSSNPGKWMSKDAQFIKLGKVPNVWAIYSVAIQSGLSRENLFSFKQAFMAAARTKGFKFPEPADIKVISPNEFVSLLPGAVDARCEFIMTITEDSINNFHGLLKFSERKYEIVMQDVKMTSAIKIVRENKRLTLENIFAKTNLKLGGLNYIVNNKFLTEDQLLIGVGQSVGGVMVPEKEGFSWQNPTIYGFTSNALSTHEFVGDFVMTPFSSSQMIAVIDYIVQVAITTFQEARKRIPKRIVIYRTATSESAFSSILEYEIPLIKKVLKQFDAESKITYIVVNKEQSVRLFRTELSNESTSASYANVPPGISVDKEATHPGFKQFFLNSHTTIQGTARTPLYTVIHDENNASMEILQSLTYALCHHHQIITSTISLPAPLYIANEYAKRGRTLWCERINDKETSSKGSRENLDNEKLEDIINELAYKGTKLSVSRINA